MANYGKLLDGFSNPKYEIYALVSDYYDNPLMTKVKVEKNFCFYVAKIPTMLLRESRFIIAIVRENNLPIGSSERLSEIPWDSFQTRTLEEEWKVKPFSYSSKNEQKYQSPIKLHRRDYDTDIFYYRSDVYPIEIALLSPKNNLPSYPSEGTIKRALETFQTVIVFL